MATRYSGRVKIVLFWNDFGQYDARVSAPGERTEGIAVGAPAHLTHAVDSSVAYDSAASAALSFSSKDMQEEAQVNQAGTGWHISRKPMGRSYDR